MKLSFKCLPVGNLPYENNELATKLTIKLFDNIPFLADLPNADDEDNLLNRTLEGVPGFKLKHKRVIVEDSNRHKLKLTQMDAIFNNPDIDKLEEFKFHTFFLDRYLQIIKRIKPRETVINLLGPLTIAQLIENKEASQILADKFYRKLFIQTVTIRALWIIHRIKEVSPDTLPIIILEEPLLGRFGDLKRENEELTRDIIVNMYAKITQKIKEFHGAVGIQCFEKCDWKIPIDAGVDLISFDAYTNPNNINIIAEHVNNFLMGGGRINWAIVPVMTEARVKELTIDKLYDRFIKTVEALVLAGVSEYYAYNRASVSIQGNTDKLPLIFAEKAIILAKQLSRKIPTIKAHPTPDSNQ